MIDWWASKIGMLIFLVIVLGSLLSFANMQVSALSNEKNYRIASDIARVIDSVGSMEGSYSEYKMETDNYMLIVDTDHIEFNGIKRYFASTANQNVISSNHVLKFENNNGVVNVW